MIKELANKDLIHGSLFKKYFTEKPKNENEQEKEKIITKLLLDFYQKLYDKETKNIDYSMFDYDFYKYGYLENYGYYIIDYDNWGYYLINCYEDNHYDAFIALAIKILDKKAEEYTQKNRKLLKKDFKTRFKNIKYNDSLYAYEYELLKWKEYFDGIIPEKIIEKYNNRIAFNYSLNINGITLKYDVALNKFVPLPKDKTKKLVK